MVMVMVMVGRKAAPLGPKDNPYSSQPRGALRPAPLGTESLTFHCKNNHSTVDALSRLCNSYVDLQ